RAPHLEAALLPAVGHQEVGDQGVDHLGVELVRRPGRLEPPGAPHDQDRDGEEREPPHGYSCETLPPVQPASADPAPGAPAPPWPPDSPLDPAPPPPPEAPALAWQSGPVMFTVCPQPTRLSASSPTTIIVEIPNIACPPSPGEKVVAAENRPHLRRIHLGPVGRISGPFWQSPV